MTTKVVEDDVRIKFNKTRLELENRVAGGKVDVERAADLLQLALENPPTPCENSSRTYVLESSWSYDNSHREFFTYTLEYCDYMNDGSSFDDLLNPDVPMKRKKELFRKLIEIYNAQVPGHGCRNMLRLYRVLENRVFGRSSTDLNGELERDVVDVHFILKPICEFNDKGEVVPCRLPAVEQKHPPIVPEVGDVVYIPPDERVGIFGGKAEVIDVIFSRHKEPHDHYLKILYGNVFSGYTWEGERGLASQQYQLALKYGDSWAHV
ncbi:MAG: hypothetical protein AAB575_02920 [Patescibacteria group bacterium]